MGMFDFDSMMTNEERRAWNIHKDFAQHHYSSCDTGVPGVGWRASSTGITVNGKSERQIEIDKAIADWKWNEMTPVLPNLRCPYCNVRALPKDRFCEGCGAPV